MSSFLPSFMKRSSAEPAETTPLKTETDAEAMEKGSAEAMEKGSAPTAAAEPNAERKAELDIERVFLQGAAHDTHPILGQVLQTCAGLGICLLVALIICTIATLVMTAHVLLSDCAVWGVWQYTLVAVVILLLDPIVEYGVQKALSCWDSIFSMGGDKHKRDSNILFTRLALYLNLCRTLVNAVLVIWGLVVWTNLRYSSLLTCARPCLLIDPSHPASARILGRSNTHAIVRAGKSA